VRANSDGQRLAFSLLTTDDPQRMRIAEEVARQWRFIGVAATVESVDAQTFVESRLNARDFDVALVMVDVGPDPDLYPLWHSSQAAPPGLNFSGFRDERLDDALERARQTTDTERRKDLYDLAAGYLLTEMPAVPLYHPQFVYAQSRDLQGFEPATLITTAARFTDAASWYVATTTE
jgi:peptide/nickel transport system substrate-binding protein